MTGERLNTDRYYVNEFLGHEDQHFPSISDDYVVQEKAELYKQAKLLLQNFNLSYKKFQKSKDYGSDYSVYTGTSGVALMYWHLSQTAWESLINIEPDAGSSTDCERKDYEKKAVLMIEKALRHLKGRRMSFLAGDAGPLSLALVMHTKIGQADKAKEDLSRLIGIQKLVFEEDGRDPVCNEMLYGRAGYLYSLLFAKQHVGELIENSFIKRIVDRLINSGKTAKNKDILYYEWHEKCYLGAAHGIAGLLYTLLKAHAFLSAEQIVYVQKTLDWLLTQCFSSGNLRSSLNSNDDKLVHWCHGAPGAVYLFLEAHTVFKNKVYLDAAIKSADVIWERGLLKKSYSLCHGVAGNAYGLMAMYQHTKEELYLKRAFIFARWCFEYGKKNIQVPDRPLSLFEGLAGVIYMLYDFIGDVPQFPAFQL